MSRFLRSCRLALCAVAFASGAWAQTPQEIVDQFFPADALPVEELNERLSCFAVHASDASGPTTLIAAYSNSTRALVRVLGRSSGVWSVAAESASDLLIIGGPCAIGLADVDGDAAPDAVVNLQRAGGDELWLFHWSGTELTSLTPTRQDDDARVSELLNSSVVDLYHDGTRQVFSNRAVAHASEPQTTPSLLFKAGPGGFVIDREALLAAEFAIADTPEADWWTFQPVAGRTGPYSLRVTNGDRAGLRRATGGSIMLNDVELLGPGQLNAGVEFLNLPLGVTLADVNRLDVNLTGPAGSIVTVAIGFSPFP